MGNGKKTLDFVGNLDHVTLGLRLGGDQAMLRVNGYDNDVWLIVTIYSGSAALAEVCDLLSVH